jgi:hypothetical protein
MSLGLCSTHNDELHPVDAWILLTGCRIWECCRPGELLLDKLKHVQIRRSEGGLLTSPKIVHDTDK